ncbi:hypothetical protein D9X58_20785 [Shigella sonnei]|nr:hypothetical protein [Escherichia coli]EFX8467277.1 hypothetical protein [Shigella sonnei]EFY1993434.1 hypothetical protein [Shigella sonnei]
MAAVLYTLLPRLDNLPGLFNLRKTTCQGGFFVYRQQITREKKGSQEDLEIFLHIPSHDKRTEWSLYVLISITLQLPKYPHYFFQCDQ